jgi:Putative polyhydroxyalkanoic acid system protein (PHA_gran_rgn)
VSEPVVIGIPHRLGKSEPIRRVKTGLAAANLPFITIDREEWKGDLLEFSQQASGTAFVLEDAVRLTIVLPWLLRRFAELAGGAVATRTKLLLEKK